MSKVQTRMFQRFTQRLFGLCFLLVLFFSVITPSPGICSTDNQLLRADFVASAQQVCLGQRVSFTSTSTGSPKSIFWDIDNNGSVDYSGSSISHIYALPGTYSVRLLIIGESNVDIEVKENLIIVNPPTRLFVTPRSLETCNGRTVMIHAEGAMSYRWEYSDGTRWLGVSSLAFQPKASGTLTVTGSNEFGCTDVRNIPIRVLSTPTAKTFITHPTTGDNGQLSAYAENGLPPYLYQVNNGGYMYNNVFNNLPAGEHVLSIKDANGCESQQKFTLTTPVACGRPQNLTLAQLRSTDIVLTWKEVAGAKNYTIYGTGTDGNSATFDWNATGVRFIGLTPNMSYQVYIVANCENGKSQPSEMLNFTTPGSNSCPRPNVWVSDVTSHGATINYNYTSSNAVNNLLIWYRVNGAFNWTRLMVSSASQSLDLRDLEAGAEYEVRVGTVCQGNNAVWSETVMFKTMPLGCLTPNKANIFPTSTTANVSWEINSSVTAYALRWKLTGTARWNTRVFGGNTTQFTINNLIPNRIYDVKLTNICNSTESDGWVAQFNTASAKESDVISSNNAGFTVYPNPNSGDFQVSLSGVNESEAQIRLMDLSGKVIFVQSYELSEMSDQILAVRLQNVNAGIYLLEISAGTRILSQKLIVE